MTAERRRSYPGYDEELQHRLLQWETAQLRVEIDQVAGAETPEWIRAIAEHEPRPRPA